MNHQHKSWTTFGKMLSVFAASFVLTLVLTPLLDSLIIPLGFAAGLVVMFMKSPMQRQFGHVALLGLIAGIVLSLFVPDPYQALNTGLVTRKP